jgi:hypothetical protein
MHARATRSAVTLLVFLAGAIALILPPPAALAEPDGAQTVLTAVSGTGSGHVLIAPTAEDHGTFAVEVTVDVHGASPNTTYTVSRAVDLNPDGLCTLASGWLINGPLDTSAAGAGAAQFEVHRGAPFVSGTRFDVEFRALAADGSELRSDCVTVTVK